MINKAERKLSTFAPSHRLSLRCEDVLATPLHDASGVIINYTLQFLPLAKRLELLRKIYDGLKPGGLLFLSEKIVSRHPQIQETTTDLYYGFKSHNRYSEREIARKKESLENILVPLSEDRLSALLSEAGFICHESVMKWNNFVSIVAIKEALP
jgi:tRNA (cmo5U34)-methyltransferase